MQFGKFLGGDGFEFIIVIIPDDFLVNYLEQESSSDFIKLYAELGVLECRIDGRRIHFLRGNAVIQSELCLRGYLNDLADGVRYAITGSFDGFVDSVGVKGNSGSVPFGDGKRHRQYIIL